MPTPAIALKLKKFRRHFGIASPRVVVRSHFPWQWISVAAFSLFVLLTSVIWLMLSDNEVVTIGREVAGLRLQLAEQREELALLRSTAGTGQNAVSIERAAQRQLLAKLEGLERENAALKEDVLSFERLIPVVGEEAVVRLESFRVIREVAGHYRYRMLLAFQPARQVPEFRGQLQIAITYMLSGKQQQLLLPNKRDAANKYQLELKNFLRREGDFDLPPGAELKVVEARILQGGTLKSKRLAQF
ncbi:MAG: DUF6776 family protein [Azonexus sp.]|nr:hypothetical protein [Azonexus sp.]MDP3638154.1 hypothetical protein [Azonexus sp.]MDZ4316153.1 DUF6776 family protein [Azonexus sp.]